MALGCVGKVRGLENQNALSNQFENSSVIALQRELKWLGLWKFAGAVMYVLHEVFEGEHGGCHPTVGVSLYLSLRGRLFCLSGLGYQMGCACQNR